MPCINETPDEVISELSLQNKRLAGALCAALRTLFDTRTSNDPADENEAYPVTELKAAYRLVNLTDSGVNAAWLRSWWHQHVERDTERRKREAAAAKKGTLSAQALAKLTPDEREALGYPRNPKEPRQPAHESMRRNQGMPGGDV